MSQKGFEIGRGGRLYIYKEVAASRGTQAATKAALAANFGARSGLSALSTVFGPIMAAHWQPLGFQCKAAQPGGEGKGEPVVLGPES
jgi:hypothetical protein